MTERRGHDSLETFYSVLLKSSLLMLGTAFLLVSGGIGKTRSVLVSVGIGLFTLLRVDIAFFLPERCTMSPGPSVKGSHATWSCCSAGRSHAGGSLPWHFLSR